MARTRMWISVVVVMAAAATSVEASGERPGGTRVVRQSADVSDLGLSTEISAEGDGGVLLRAWAGDLTFRKVVYADGRFRVELSEGDDTFSLAGEPGTVHLARGKQRLTYRPDRDDERQIQSVRVLLASSRAVGKLRQLTTALEERGLASAEALGLRITGALLGELDGDSGAARRLNRAMLARLAPRVRMAQTTPPPGAAPNCYDRYSAIVVEAAKQLEACLGSFNVWNPYRQVCAFVWTLQIESAWFAFLACSAVPLR